MNAESASAVHKPNPRLDQAPITEVICGLIFPKLAGFDVFEFGLYWDERRKEFPGKDLQPAIADQLTVNIGGLQEMRMRLMSPPPAELVQQIQADRFYMSWRRREGRPYPHFSDRPGLEPGLKARTLDEFGKLRKFCKERPTITGTPQVDRVELAKIDVLRLGVEWQDLNELAELLPITRPFTEVRVSDNLNLAIQVHEQEVGGWRLVRINSGTHPGSGAVAEVRLETRTSISILDNDLEKTLGRASARLNDMFFKLIPDASTRFR